MGDRAWYDAPPPACEEPKRESIDPGNDRRSPALIDVTGCENQSLQTDGRRQAARQRPELPLQVAAVNDFLANAGSDRYHDPRCRFHRTGRKQERDMRWRRAENLTKLPRRHAQESDKCNRQ